MKAMIFAAGLGTRLKPITNSIPKALVPVGGIPMLEHAILNLKAAGFTEIVVNIHHFGQQIIDFLKAKNNFGIRIYISDERDKLLDTGGGIKKAGVFFAESKEPFLLHNVDIFSNVDLKALYQYHLNSKNTATLLVSARQTSRYLLFNKKQVLCGWINKKTGEVKPDGFTYDEQLYGEYAFSGIHVLSPSIFSYMKEFSDVFSIIDFYLSICPLTSIGGYFEKDLDLLDVGKMKTLADADRFIEKYSVI